MRVMPTAPSVRRSAPLGIQSRGTNGFRGRGGCGPGSGTSSVPIIFLVVAVWRPWDVLRQAAFGAQALRQHLQDQLESLDDVVEAEVFHHGEHVRVHVDEVCGCSARSRVVERVVLLSRLKNGPAPWREARRDVRRVG